MLISELPPELQELVRKRQIEQGNDGTFMEDISNDKWNQNFNYDCTPEGYNFWDRVRNGEDMSKHEFYPKVTKQEDTNLFKFC